MLGQHGRRQATATGGDIWLGSLSRQQTREITVMVTYRKLVAIGALLCLIPLNWAAAQDAQKKTSETISESFEPYVPFRG
jgi:hypothetical protein